MLAEIRTRLSNAPNSINKFEMARTVLTGLNEIGDSAIRERREILKRVVEFEDFSTCWENDRLEAQGLVAKIRDVVNVKDSFTRMNQERTAEVRKRRETQDAATMKLRQRRERMAKIRQEFSGLFAIENAQERGLRLERVLNEIFDVEGILVQEDFRRIPATGQGVIEQIDGVIQLDGNIYLVEMKWLKGPVSVEKVSQHLVRVFGHSSKRGIFISYSDFTKPAIETCREFLNQAVIVLCTVEEFFLLVEKEASLKEFLTTKIQHSIVNKQPLMRVL